MRGCEAHRGSKLLEHGLKMLDRVFESRISVVVDVDAIQYPFLPEWGRYMLKML